MTLVQPMVLLVLSGADVVPSVTIALMIKLVEGNTASWAVAWDVLATVVWTVGLRLAMSEPLCPSVFQTQTSVLAVGVYLVKAAVLVTLVLHKAAVALALLRQDSHCTRVRLPHLDWDGAESVLL